MLFNRPIAVDLFGGAGGMTLGFEQAGFDVLAAVEIDPIHCATHQFNFPFWTVFCKSITEITGAEIRQKSAIGNREIDVVFGGPPCQGFSLMGKRSLDDPRNTLVFHFIRLILELKPKYFVMENVPGITLGDHRYFIQEIIQQFYKQGYQVEQNYQLLNAADYGVPQNRERLFLWGGRSEFSLPTYPKKLTTLAPSALTKVRGNSLTPPTVWEAIQDLPEVENYPELLERDWTIVEFGNPSDYGKILRGLIELDKDYSYKRLYNPDLLTSSFRTQHTQKSIQRFEATSPGKIEPISRFYKLDPNGRCNTLRAGTPSNRGAFTAPRPIHPFTPRCITVREAARLHSYPDWFRFHATKWHGFRQVGNSVPPFLAKAVATAVIDVLGVCPSKPTLAKELGEENLLSLKMSKAAQYYGVSSHVIEPRIRNNQC